MDRAGTAPDHRSDTLKTNGAGPAFGPAPDRPLTRDSVHMNSLQEIPVGALIPLAVLAGAIAFKIAIVIALWRLLKYLKKQASPPGLHEQAHSNKKQWAPTAAAPAAADRRSR